MVRRRNFDRDETIQMDQQAGVKHTFSGIAGLEGREPIGAVLTIGTKGPTGAPIDRDRLYFKLPFMDGNGARPVHPDFARYHEAPALKRQSIKGNLVHANRADCFEFYLRAHKLPIKGYPATPRQEPACTGDGCTALRWKGAEEGFVTIKCPNDLCEFRQGANKTCKPFARLLFRPRWNPAASEVFPSPLTKLVTSSWNSVSAMKGFFDYVEKSAAEFGMHNVNLFGLPIVITLSEKSQPAEKRKFPVLSITPDGDLIAFLQAQQGRMKELAQARPVAGLLDADEQDAEVIAKDANNTVPGPYRPRGEGE